MRSKDPKASKRQLDRETEYLTFLPEMDEGFQIGYHTEPGIVNDRNPNPGEWLESLARNIRTERRGVIHAIPDVMAGEQQLRRVARAGTAEALAHPQVTAWRAVLALLLLWDAWPRDDTWPALESANLTADGTAFGASVLAAMDPVRAASGIRVFLLRDRRPGERNLMPLALLSSAMLITPAAETGDLSPMLPACVTWYDREKKRFSDPCGTLCAADCARLVARIRMLQRACETAAPGMPLSRTDPALFTVLDRFATDLLAPRAEWLERVSSGAADAELKTRALACFGPRGAGMPDITERVSDPADSPAANPLIRVLSGEALPAAEKERFTEYCFRGVPVACFCGETALRPSRAPGEDEALRALEKEISLKTEYDIYWRRETARALRREADALLTSAGVPERLPGLLRLWAGELDALPDLSSDAVTLQCPLEECPSALISAVEERIGLNDAALIRDPFSSCLTVFRSLTEAAGCVTAAPDGNELAALLPLNPAFCEWLCTAPGEDRPRADADHFECIPCGSGFRVRVSVLRRRKTEQGSTVGKVIFEKTFSELTALEPEETPCVTVWPNVCLKDWHSWYIHLHGGAPVCAAAFAASGPVYADVHGTREYRVFRTDAFPALLALTRGGKSLGALVNDIPERIIRREDAAAVAVDFGSVSTAVLLRQGEKLQPAVLPEPMHGVLLATQEVSRAMLADEFLPADVLLPASALQDRFYSVQDMFADDPEGWKQPLCDGHIYYPEGCGDIVRKSSGTLYYDLKWGNEAYSRLCLRLFLKQVLLQASLSAALWGSSSASWRVAMPGAMPLPRREAYLEMMRGLAREVAAECGLPLTQGIPSVLYADENRADGLYFLSRSEVNGHSGYINLDIGGSTVDISLWLKDQPRAAMAVSLPEGCRQMLFESLLERHPADFAADLSGPGAPDALASDVSDLLRLFSAEGASSHGRQKCMLLLDDLMASHAEDISLTMRRARARGEITYLESLLLFECCVLMLECGEMLRRACEEPSLRALLPQRMELCIAGNGGRLFALFDDEQRTRLCRLAMSRIQPEHPLQVLMPILSRNPKQEVARGLLHDDTLLSSAIHSMPVWNGTRTGVPAPDLLREYLRLFSENFPQAAYRLMPGAFAAGNGFDPSPAAQMELDTVFANRRTDFPGDDLTMYMYCFSDLKRVWKL